MSWRRRTSRSISARGNVLSNFICLLGIYGPRLFVSIGGSRLAASIPVPAGPGDRSLTGQGAVGSGSMPLSTLRDVCGGLFKRLELDRCMKRSQLPGSLPRARRMTLQVDLTHACGSSDWSLRRREWFIPKVRTGKGERKTLDEGERKGGERSKSFRGGSERLSSFHM